MGYAIETKDLTKRFSHPHGLLGFLRFSDRTIEETIAVNKVNIMLEEGQVYTLLGPNGAGKTTLIKMLCTSIIPSSGSGKIYGYDIVSEEYQVRKITSLVSSDERSFFWRLTGRENLRFFASIYKLSNKETKKRIDYLLDLFDLSDVADIRFNEFSTGMKQKLALARGLLSKPKMLFLDEPTKGLDPVSALLLQDLIKERVVNHLGNSVLVTTHILSEAEQLSNRVIIMNRGRIVANGSTEEIKWSCHQYEKYRLEVKNLSEEDIGKITQMEDIASCSMLHGRNGIINVEIELPKNTKDISDILGFILQSGGRILKCTIIEKTLEDVFHALVQQKG